MGSIISGIGSMIGGNEAARKAEAASSNLSQRYSDISGYTMPYIQAGQNVLQPLTALATGSPTGGGPNYVSMAQSAMPGMMTQAQLEQTPGYQFNLSQNMKALQSSAAARGLGVSGASIKAGQTYASGLAGTTYQAQFNNAQSRFADYGTLNSAQQANLTSQAARLQSVANMGAQTGAQLGGIGANLAGTQANALTAAGNDLAGGTKGLAQGIGGSVQDILGTPTTVGGPSLGMQALNYLFGPSGQNAGAGTNA
jgi:hypothetical protein